MVGYLDRIEPYTLTGGDVEASEKEKYFLREAFRYAAQLSNDPSTQNGAVLVRDGAIVGWGANHFPDGVAVTDERWERPGKYLYVEHAERNAIYHAAKHGTKTNGLTMYVAWFACADCARAIIQSGIAEVVGAARLCSDDSTKWTDSIRVAETMLREAGVKVRYIDGLVGGPEIRFNGEIIST